MIPKVFLFRFIYVTGFPKDEVWKNPFWNKLAEWVNLLLAIKIEIVFSCKSFCPIPTEWYPKVWKDSKIAFVFSVELFISKELPVSISISEFGLIPICLKKLPLLASPTESFKPQIQENKFPVKEEL